MIFLVVPCYNEKEVLPSTNKRLKGLLKELPSSTHILYVDDGSTDDTWEIIKGLSKEQENVDGLRLSHNVGQQAATWAGMEACINRKAKAIISLDADLQDDIKVIPHMVKLWMEGADIVYGVRKGRRSDSFMKRFPALCFYKLMQHLGCNMVYNHSEFRLLSRRASEALLSYPERNLFVRGLLPMIGFNETTVFFDRQARKSGKTKYSWKKLMMLAMDGITSFTVKPLHWILALGGGFIFISLCVIVWALRNFWTGMAVSGWTSLLVSLWFVSGCILLSIGIIGEYIGKVYIETKQRPRFFVMEKTF